MNFTDIINESFLRIWRDRPSATLHWILPKDDEGFWRLMEDKKIVLDQIPNWVGCWIWHDKELAEDVFPDPNAKECVWHLVLLP